MRVRRGARQQSTDLSDAEVNSYLRYAAGAQVPVGVDRSCTLSALGNGRVTGRAIVDLDAVRQQKQRGWIDPARLPDRAACP